MAKNKKRVLKKQLDNSIDSNAVPFPSKADTPAQSELNSPASVTQGLKADAKPTRFDALMIRIKNHPIVASLLIVGIVIIALGSFTDAISKIVSSVGALVNHTQANRQLPVALLIDQLGTSSIVNGYSKLQITFSVVNSAKDRNFELTSVYANQVKSVDICRTCSIGRRIPLELKLSPTKQEQISLVGQFDENQNQLFGQVGSYHLAPGESAPFSLSLQKPSNVGSIFYLSLAINDIEKAQKVTMVPPYLFYVVGPLEYPEPRITVVEIDGWLKNPDPYLRVNIASAIGIMRDQRGKSSVLSAAQRDEKAYVRAAAILALGNFPGDDSFQTLLAPLTNLNFTSASSEKDNGNIRRAAAEALGIFKDERALPYLYSAWQHNSDFWVANEAIISIGRIGGKNALSKLNNILKEFDSGEPPEYQHRSSIIEAIGLLEDKGVTEILIDELLSYQTTRNDSWSRASAAAALGQRRGDKMIKALVKACENDPDPIVRERAISSLVTQSAREAIDVLRYAASCDPEAFVRESAARAVNKMSTKVK